VRSITIILSTYNRSRDLRATLEAFYALDRDGLDVEFVIVDNNSTDDTPQVLDEFRGRLPLRSIFHPEPGKNRALNRALDETSLRDIVVFTDDDVTPRRDWLQQIARSSEANPEYQVFGGKIEIVWPDGAAPRWATAGWIQVFAFALHDRGNQTVAYEPGDYPYGPNMWVRSSVFAHGLRYNERIGPQPRKRLMGSETTFLMALASGGHRMLYIPEAVVGHRVQARELNRKMVARRAARLGRSNPHVYGLPDVHLLARSRTRWLMRRALKIARACLVELRAAGTRSESKRFERRCAARQAIALHTEAIKLAFAKPDRPRDAPLHSRVAKS
jgi:glycosyltransferase involved in cell wall biosynthesis